MTVKKSDVVIYERNGVINISYLEGYLPRQVRWDFSNATPVEIDYIYRCILYNKWLKE